MILDFSLGQYQKEITFLILFILAGSIHELAHAASAYVLGDSTAKMAGRLTLNPVAHIDIIGLFFIIFANVGWMKPVPVNPYNLRHPERDLAIVSFAGPFSNFVQACLVILCLNLFDFGFTKYYLIQFAFLNILLMGFNLLPFPPLDGGSILRYFLPSSMLAGYDVFSRYSFIILIILMFMRVLPYFLKPFISLFYWLVEVELLVMVAINIANGLILLYFFRDELLELWQRYGYKIKDKAVKNTDAKTAKLINLKTGKKLDGDEFLSKIKKKDELTEKDYQELGKMKAEMDKQIKLCPIEDYNPHDKTCENCEWLGYCVVRDHENNLKNK